MIECSCLSLKLESWSGIYRSSVRKRGMRGADDGIIEIDDRSNFLRERERWTLWRTEDWKNKEFLMVSKVGNGVLDLQGGLEKRKKVNVWGLGVGEWESGLVLILLFHLPIIIHHISSL